VSVAEYAPAAEWLRVRRYLQRSRHELAGRAAAQYPVARRVAGTGLLAAPGWIPDEPIELGAVALRGPGLAPAETGLAPATGPGATALGTTPAPGPPAPGTAHGPGGKGQRNGPGGWTPPPGWERAMSELLPRRPDGSAFAGYSGAMAELDRPGVFENRVTYRLLDARLAGDRPFLTCGTGRYFDAADVGEACAHEFAAAVLAADHEVADHRTADHGPARYRSARIAANAKEEGEDRDENGPAAAGGMPLRAALGEPWDLSRRPANLAISTLTLRRDPGGGTATFPLHWRDPGRVAHAGGLYQVVPVGMFQPADDDPRSRSSDFDLWRGMQREFAEELLGAPEEYPQTPVSYADWPFARRLDQARAAGAVRPWVLGLGVDPLTFATDLLTAVVIDAPVFDDLFGAIVDHNAEGRVLFGAADRGQFTADGIGALAGPQPMQAAGAALLRLAWRHRAPLLA
jgi:hypothetical protein